MSEADKHQESEFDLTRELTLNIDQAIVTYLAYTHALENAKSVLKVCEDNINTLPFKRPEFINSDEKLREHQNLARHTIEKLVYLIQEVKELIIELEPESKNVIQKPNWNG